MGVAVFAGMLGVTMFGLFLTPVFYVLISRLVERFSRRRIYDRAAPARAILEGQ
jgi:hypothetical protein